MRSTITVVGIFSSTVFGKKTEDGPSLLAKGRPFMACCLTVDYFSGRSVTVMADLLLPWISITKPSAASVVSAIMP